MQEMIDRIAAQVGIDPSLAEKAIAMIVDFISVHAPARYVDELRQLVPGFDQVAAAGAATAPAAAAPASGGGLMGALGGLMGGGGLAGALGGLMGGADGNGLGAAMALVGNLQKDGLDLGQVQGLAGGLIDEFKQAAGPEVVDGLIAGLPGIGRFVG